VSPGLLLVFVGAEASAPDGLLTMAEGVRGQMPRLQEGDVGYSALILRKQRPRQRDGSGDLGGFPNRILGQRPGLMPLEELVEFCKRQRRRDQIALAFLDATGQQRLHLL